MSCATQHGVVELHRVTKRYGDELLAVSELTLRVRQGELLALLGPSGCGKTTTLRLIAGLLRPSGGRITLDGVDITDWPSHRRDMGVVFQSYALFPHLNVGQNIAFGLEMRRIARREITRMVGDVLSLVRLNDFDNRRTRELSGGQQQRVALARALVIRPKVLLLDEPLSNLDATLREELRHEIRDIQQQLGITTIFVTHDQAEALSMSDRIAVMKQGRFVQIGNPSEIYERPEDPFVAGFIGRINSFVGTVQTGRPCMAALDGGTRVRLPRDFEPGQSVLIMIRPHRLDLRQAQGEISQTSGVTCNGIKGRVRKVTYVGDVVQYRIETGGPELLCEQGTRTASGTRYAAGNEVLVEWSVADTLVFNREDVSQAAP
jgi:putative spermidine/putrescine transport system ATP-binding protein